MKFFTFDLWQDLQKGDADQASREWSRRSARYLSRLDMLKPRLGSPAHRFFTTKGFHDSRLISVEMGRPEQLDFILDREGERFALELRGVRKWLVNYKVSRDSLDLGRPFEWGYEEFSPISGNRLQLDILFSSGATFTVQFSKLRVRQSRSG